MSESRPVLFDKDIDPIAITGLAISVIGYGNQGHAHALNLKDAGHNVKVGLRENSPSASTVAAQGLTVASIEEAARAQVVMILVPDEVQPQLFESHIKEHLAQGAVVLFGHGFALHHQLITMPEGVEAALVAPVGPGHLLRRRFVEGGGIPGLVAVAEGSHDHARRIALAYARAIGLGRLGIIEASIKEEVETDLFGEQAIICGGVSALIRTGFEVLTEAGYPEELAYYECAHQMKLLVDLIYERGIAGMRDGISNTAKYGDLTRGPRVVDERSKAAMQQILREIQTGDFGREWMAEVRGGGQKLQALADEAREHPIETVGARLRKLAQQNPKPD